MEEEKEPRKSEEPHGPTTAKPQKMDTDAISSQIEERLSKHCAELRSKL